MKSSFIDKFLHIVSVCKNKIAVVDNSSEISFSILELRARRLAKLIVDRDLGDNPIVVIQLNDCADYLVAQFGVWLAGGAVVPLNVSYPKARVAGIIEQTNSKLTITQELMNEVDNYEPLNEHIRHSKDDKFAMFFTSGSTGQPKGIVHTIDCWTSGVERSMPFECQENDVYVNNSPFYFVAQFMLFPFLFEGATVHIIPAEMRRDMKQLSKYVEQNGVTALFISPSVLPYFETESKVLRLVTTGSEKLTNVGPKGYKLLYTYGLSETLPLSIYFVVDRPYENTPLGEAFPGVEVVLLDESGNKVAQGEEGEICLKGCFAREYLNQKEATEELYKYGVLHTKDIGRELEDGRIMYVNRKDWMLKINGQRVEPSEIEMVMKRVAGVENAIVKGFEVDCKALLCAYYIGENVDLELLKAELLQQLPSYMIPAYFVRMEAFPVNQNGKLDRLSLQLPELVSVQKEYVAPQTDAEKVLCEAFEQIFKLEKVGVDDDFFDLGGDSIRIMKLQGMIESLELNSALIFKGRTPREIARLSSMAQIIEIEVKDSYPLTQTQMGIYVECQARRGEICYNLPRLFTFSKQVDLQRLSLAVEAVVEAHSYIKTRIELSDSGEICQKRCDLNDYNQGVETIHDIEEVKSLLVQPFDLNKDQLFRIRLLSAETQNYMFLDFHHIIFDGSSFEVLIRDINKAYRGEELDNEELSGYDIAFLEERLRAGEAYLEAKAWHTSVYEGVDVDSLPITDQKESSTGFGKESLHSLVSQTDIAKVCSANNVSENVLFNAAFTYFLAAYNNANEALYATIYNGRSSVKSLNSISMLVKTLTIYQDITSVKTVKSLLQSVQGQLLEAMNNDIYSFAEASEQFGLSSNLLFAYQGDLKSENMLCGEQMQMEDLLENATGETISLQVFKSDNGYSFECEFNREVYSNELMEEFLISFDEVIKGFLVYDELKNISLIGDSQLIKMEQFNETGKSYDKGLTVVDMIRQRAVELPDNLAVVYKDKRYTYRELDEVSDNLAAYVESQGLKNEDVVAILIPRCEYMAIASLGVVKAGCIYQPLDATYPQERLEFMIEDSSAKLLIADESLLELLPNYKGKLLLTKDILKLEPAQPTANLLLGGGFNLLYTSGSTGLPKGCIIEHCNIVAFVNSCKNIYEITPEDNITAYASFGFDASMWETYQTLAWGATLHIIAEEIRLNLIDLEQYFIDNHITISFMTTQVGRQFALSVGSDTSLRHLSTGGEKLVALDPPTHFTLHNCYGPTEATVFVTRYALQRKENNIPIGKAVENIKAYVVNSFGQRQPVGGIGELWVSGAQVARGYLNRPEVTEKVFIENPYTQDDSYERVYRTGDIVRLLVDGNVEFIGRRDAQVKIRGFRVELTEVEGVIREFESVKDATVQAYDMEGGGKYIAAFIVGDNPIDIEKLSEFILENKPPYILPAVIMQIDAIPLTQNQKVNKKALPKPELVAVPGGDEGEEINRPLNILEQEIKDVVCSVVNTNEIGLTTKLLYAGLTSISSIKLATLLYKRFDINLDTKKLSKEYSILDIENVILEKLLSGGSVLAGVVEAQIEGVKEYYPLSYSQLGVYYECVKNPLSTTYNIPLYLAYSKNITTAEIADAVRKIIDLNPYLMICFDTQNGEVVQRISKQDYEIAQLELQEQDIKVFENEFVKPYNLQKDTLFRIACVATEQKNYLFLDFHHLIFDGASCDLFITQLNRLLSGEDMEVSNYSYFNYIDDERDAEQSEVYTENADYFAARLQLCEGGTEIPVELNKSADQAKLGVVEKIVTCGEISEFCRREGVSPAQLYLAAALYTVSRFANTKNVYISTISNGRSNIKTAYTYGMMVKTLPIASFISDQNVLEFVRETSSDFEQTISHENYPYAKIANDFHFSPEIMYAYQVGVLNKYKAKGEDVGYGALGFRTPKFKMSIHIASIDDKDAIVLEYNEALYSEYFISQFAMSMDQVLSNFIDEPSQLLKNVSIVSKEQNEELDKFHNVAEEYDHIGYYYSGLESYAKETPEAMALIACDAKFTYSEMNAEANKVANALIRIGVKIGDRVAILLPRTSRLIISMYGVSKAGAAYIPCDVEYPKDRIDHVLEDSEARFVITTKDRLGEFADGVAVDVEELFLEENASNPGLEFSVDELAYIIYTSGSTGKPKGVLLMHKGISNYVHNHPANRHVHALVSDATKYLSVTTISFDMSLKEIAITIANGVTLIIADENQANNPILLTKLFEETGADAFNATPSRMLQYMEFDGFCDALSRCNIIMSGGEKFSAQLLSSLKTVSKARIFNTYGPTEITVSSNARELTNEDIITIGQPLLNYTEFVVDSDGNELPAKVVGELYIGGIGVAKGYNKLEEMTKERFVDYKGMRVYRSGDYAMWDKMGNISILGRTDNQVKLRGLRIELGEIEANISKFDGIRNVVAVIKEIKGKEHIAAYFTASQDIDVMELKEEIGKGLAAYMVPTAYLQMDSLPQTPNGKTDLKALPEANLLAVSGGEEAANDLEQSFCDMFAQILELDNVGATDSFFEIGGSSLVATRLIIESSKLGYEIAYGEVFEYPTPRELANLVGGSDQDIANEKKKEEDEYSDVVDYDYSVIQPILEANTLENLQKGEFKQIRKVLLAGTTGFLGIHILKQLLDDEEVSIYCLLRSKGGVSAEQRLKTMLFYYFENTYEELLGERLFVINGDLNAETKIEVEGVDTVINCAAIVKHFAKGNEIYDVNLGGVNKLIDFCLSQNARLIQVSTMSVNGFAVYPDMPTQYKEQELYKGQLINNKYIHSKFLAERSLLDAVATRGLDGKIMRVGNLSARNSDGEFQINFNTNSFMNRLKVYNVLGVCPYEELDNLVEFSPIDEVAKAILLLSTTPKECCIFHPFNNHSIFKGDIFSQMAHLGIKVQPVEMQEYIARVNAVKSDVDQAANLTSIIAYENMGNGRQIASHIKSNAYTMQTLYRLNYSWPVTSWDYIERFVEVLLGFGYFNE